MNSLIGLALTALSGSEGVIWGAVEGLWGAVLGRLGGLLEKVPESPRGLEGGRRGGQGKGLGRSMGPLGGLSVGSQDNPGPRQGPARDFQESLRTPKDHSYFELILLWSFHEDSEQSQESHNMQLLSASALSVSRARPGDGKSA